MKEQQAALKAYVDIFRWTALLAFFCAAAVWLFKKPIKHTAAPLGVH
jgi:DHA2 family multidrug resistance protein